MQTPCGGAPTSMHPTRTKLLLLFFLADIIIPTLFLALKTGEYGESPPNSVHSTTMSYLLRRSSNRMALRLGEARRCGKWW